jgi:hypothetical protein
MGDQRTFQKFLKVREKKNRKVELLFIFLFSSVHLGFVLYQSFVSCFRFRLIICFTMKEQREMWSPRNFGATRMSLFFLAILLLVVLPTVHAVTWIKATAGFWNETSAWDCACVPGASDDVFISKPLAITANAPVQVSSLTLSLSATAIFLSTLSVTGAVSLSQATLDVRGSSAQLGSLTFQNGFTSTAKAAASTTINIIGDLRYVVLMKCWMRGKCV